ncbi:MAG TPA: MBOAT family O-acyltransferase [Bacteroidia bacterium]
MELAGIEEFLHQLVYDPKNPLLFNSGFFLIFLFVFLLFYQLVYKRKLSRVIYVTIFSLYFFYKASGWYFVLVMLAAVVDFNLANWIYITPQKSKKKFLLLISIVLNLGLLAYFKCTNICIDLINDISNQKFHPLNLILPVGISFYTFENLSYTIDIFRGIFRPVKSFWDYLFFLSFFPKLMMGPIVRAGDFIPQIRQDIFITREDVGKGLVLILGGLFKKAVISDYLSSNFVNYVFDSPLQHTGLECLFAVYGYAMVIYCDFSGYSDMAIGIALWLGFKINLNFDSPYQSASITEFWRRWHISLSSWLRDYLYFPLGGNRKGRSRTYANLIITMLLGGIWHMDGMLRSANLKYILWGVLHGIGLAFHKMVGNTSLFVHRTWWRKAAGIIITFHFVCFCWIFFRAADMESAWLMITQIVSNFSPGVFLPMMSAYSDVMIILAIGFILHFLPRKLELRSYDIVSRMPALARIVIILITIWIVIQLKSAEPVKPIYLQF